MRKPGRGARSVDRGREAVAARQRTGLQPTSRAAARAEGSHGVGIGAKSASDGVIWRGRGELGAVSRAANLARKLRLGFQRGEAFEGRRERTFPASSSSAPESGWNVKRTSWRPG